MSQHEKINYVELPAKNFKEIKHFYAQVFGWVFTDYGSEYVSFSNAGLDGGFFKSELCSSSGHGAALIVFYSNHLEATLDKVEDAGGVVIKPIFEFPGGRRFHFTDPHGNELAVWSDQ
jgi:predicted enzyme related to lactoylglutathione lyase